MASCGDRLRELADCVSGGWSGRPATHRARQKSTIGVARIRAEVERACKKLERSERVKAFSERSPKEARRSRWVWHDVRVGGWGSSSPGDDPCPFWLERFGGDKVGQRVKSEILEQCHFLQKCFH